MKKFKFKKIDAFATKNSTGNPAGCINLESKNNISFSEMQRIAKELKGFVNEVGYIYKIGREEYNLKYYSSEREVDFCGHATIAIMYDLIKNDNKLINTNLLTIKTNKGRLTVENRINEEDAVFIMSPLPENKEKISSINKIAAALKIDESEINNKLPIKIINAGLTTLIIPIKSLDNILNIAPNLAELKSFCQNVDIDIIELFTSEVSNKNSDFRVRVFAPTFGYLEDPATGSGNSAFGYYLLQEKMWNKETIVIEQNAQHDKYNVIKLQNKKDSNGTDRVLFGGAAIKRIDGEYTLH
jgi:PhzF family phenazine biosynthesis protein